MMNLKMLPNQQPGETLVLFLRRHWFAWAKLIVSFIVLTMVPLVTAIIFWDKLAPWVSHPVTGPILTMVASIYLLGIWLVTFLEFTDYYLDVWIVTTERVMNIEQDGLFKRTMSEMHLANIQDVTSEVAGMIPTFFKYGQVHIQTSAEKLRFEFKNIANPDQVKETIIRLVDEDKKRHGSAA